MHTNLPVCTHTPYNQNDFKKNPYFLNSNWFNDIADIKCNLLKYCVILLSFKQRTKEYSIKFNVYFHCWNN